MSDEERSRQRLQGAVGDAYRIGRLIGRGGFAEVFEAHDSRLGRSVAIKALRPDLVAAADVVERFQREARAMASLRHPHVMEVYTVGEAGGVAYFVMPLIAGESLGGRLGREGRLSIDEAARILREAASALDAAHRSGTVHRDIKPDNILLEGPEARVVLTDFGIAKALSMHSTALTGTGMFMGTPKYVSPEQAVGDDVDHRTDIYSLGVVAFHMIAGRLPFEARTAQALVAQHLTEEAPAVWALRPECPEQLAHVVQRCLAKDPGDRWGSAADLMAAVEGRSAVPSVVVSDMTPQSGTPTPAAENPVRRLQLTAAGLAVGAVALGGLDAAVGLGGISAWTAAGCGIFLAARAGRLWAAGLEWREILIPGQAQARVIGTEDLPGLADGEFGRFGTLVHECTADRASIMKAFAEMPRQEQARFPHLRDATEGLLHRIRHLARRVTTLEERVADTAKRLEHEREERGAAAARGAPAASRYAARLQELDAARDEAATELRASVARLEDLRDALVERLPMDAAAGMLDVERSLRLAVEFLRQGPG